MKISLNKMLKFFIGVQFLFCQLAFANKSELFTASNRIEIASAIVNWKTVLAIVSTQAGRENTLDMIADLKASGVDLNAPIPLANNNGTLYYNNTKIEMTPTGLNYKGIVLNYNNAKSFRQNYLDIKEKLDHKVSTSIFSIIENKANASEKEVRNLSTLLSAGAAVFTVLAFLHPAGTTKLVLISLMVAVSLAYTSAALASDSKSDDLVNVIKDFNCLKNGWSVKMTEGSAINILKNDKNEIIVEKTDKSGAKTVSAATSKQAELFGLNQKICTTGKNIEGDIKKAIEILSGANQTTVNPKAAEGTR